MVAIGHFPRLRIGAHIEADDQSTGRIGEDNIRLCDAANGAVHHTNFYFVGGKIVQGPDDGLNGPLHISTNNNR